MADFCHGPATLELAFGARHHDDDWPPGTAQDLVRLPVDAWLKAAQVGLFGEANARVHVTHDTEDTLMRYAFLEYLPRYATQVLRGALQFVDQVHVPLSKMSFLLTDDELLRRPIVPHGLPVTDGVPIPPAPPGYGPRRVMMRFDRALSEDEADALGEACSLWCTLAMGGFAIPGAPEGSSAVELIHAAPLTPSLYEIAFETFGADPAALSLLVQFTHDGVAPNLRTLTWD